MRKIFFPFLIAAGAALFGGPEQPSTPRDSNFLRTGAYDATRIQAKFTIPVTEETKVVHLIRDNSDPRVITKSYLLRHADPYEIRDCLRQVVQAKKVGNTSLLQNYPGNTAPTPAPGNAATLSSVAPATPAAAQPTFTPALQLGSNTAVECLKYADGSGVLLISAEEYRFSDHEGGMGFDSLVKFLDRPQMGEMTGTQTFFYWPKYVPARNLCPLVLNVGLNTADVTELWQGGDVAVCDPDLNLLIFDVANYSVANVEKMLRKFDVPLPQVRLRLTLYEIFAENDEKIGVDFQAWKNNGGMDFFSAGGRYRDNWSALYNGNGLQPSGSERTSFFNFNPKWNTRYLDFLAARGKGAVVFSGEVLIRNNTPASLKRTSELFYFNAPVPEEEKMMLKLFSELAGRIIKGGEDLPVWKAPPQQTLKQSSFGFSMEIANASVTEEETNFTVTLTNTSLIGFDSDGSPRFEESSIKDLNISLPHGRNGFVIGGLRKSLRVRSVSGIPFLKDIPILGKLFSTESTSIKHSSLVAAGECVLESPAELTKVRHRSKGEQH